MTGLINYQYITLGRLSEAKLFRYWEGHTFSNAIVFTALIPLAVR